MNVAKHFLNLKDDETEQLALQNGQLAIADVTTPEAYIDALETASALNDTAGSEKCASSLETAQTSVDNVMAQVEAVQPQSGAGAKKFKDVVKALKMHSNVIQKMSEQLKEKGKKGKKGKKGNNVNPGVVKRALKAAKKDCKTAQKLINS